MVVRQVRTVRTMANDHIKVPSEDILYFLGFGFVIVRTR